VLRDLRDLSIYCDFDSDVLRDLSILLLILIDQYHFDLIR
jgi:hypothetical protein